MRDARSGVPAVAIIGDGGFWSIHSEASRHDLKILSILASIHRGVWKFSPPPFSPFPFTSHLSILPPDDRQHH
jgi:hypothetical protein